jgi:hypothetical protein
MQATDDGLHLLFLGSIQVYCKYSMPNSNGEFTHRSRRLRFEEDGQFYAGSTTVFRIDRAPLY